MKINPEKVTDKGKIAMINTITDNYEGKDLEIILEVIEGIKPNQKNLKKELERKIADMDIEDIETMKTFINEVKVEHSRLKSISEYEATSKFYGETEEEYMARIGEILQRIGKNEVEKNLIGYMSSVLGMIGQDDPKNPIIMETSVVEDLLEPIVTGVINKTNVREINEAINVNIGNFFNSDYLYSPFKTDIEGEEYRLVTPTPEVYTLMVELPNVLEKITKEKVLNGKGWVKEITLQPYEEGSHTTFIIDMEYGEESQENPLLERFRVSPELMSNVYLIGVKNYGKALEYFEEVLSMCIASNIERYIKSKVEGEEFYV